jgi:hypothetical protein
MSLTSGVRVDMMKVRKRRVLARETFVTSTKGILEDIQEGGISLRGLGNLERLVFSILEGRAKPIWFHNCLYLRCIILSREIITIILAGVPKKLWEVFFNFGDCLQWDFDIWPTLSFIVGILIRYCWFAILRLNEVWRREGIFFHSVFLIVWSWRFSEGTFDQLNVFVPKDGACSFWIDPWNAYVYKMSVIFLFKISLRSSLRIIQIPRVVLV